MFELKEMIAVAAEGARQTEALLQQRDELLAALRELLDMVRPTDGLPDSRASVMRARAAIAKAEGQNV